MTMTSPQRSRSWMLLLLLVGWMGIDAVAYVEKQPSWSDSLVLSNEVIMDHEWRIHRVEEFRADFRESPCILNTSRDTTIEEARSWCEAHQECVALVFSPESFQSMLTVDLVIFLRDALPPHKRFFSKVEEILRDAVPARNQIFTKVEEILRDALPTHNQIFTKVEGIVRDAPPAHNQIFTLVEEIDSEREWVVHDLHYRSTVAGLSSEAIDNDKTRAPYRHCCKDYKPNEPDRYGPLRLPSVEELEEAETIERVSCNISRQEFVERYESKRMPVILEGCAKHWPAQERWDSLQTLAPQFHNHTMWRNTCWDRYESWWEIQEHIARGYDLCVFDQVDGSNKSQHLLRDYQIPSPFQGGDVYEQLNTAGLGFGRMAWFSLGDWMGGTPPHRDYHLPSPDQWNTLVRGTKWWTLYPQSEMLNREYNLQCDPKCSSVDNIHVAGWYTNVAFHARKHIYEDGKRPLQVLQRAGDTVYIPDGWIHSLLNYEDSIAVTEAYGSLSNLANVWKQVLVRGDEKDWTKLYYSILNAEQRKIARDSVEKERVCVLSYYYMLTEEQRKVLGDSVNKIHDLCNEPTFFSQVKQTSGVGTEPREE